MQIAVNTRFLLKDKLEGIGRFTYESLKLMVAKHPEHQFFFLFDRPFDDKYIFAENVSGVVLPPPARHPVLWYLWFEWSVAKFLNKNKPDIFLSTDGYLSLHAKVPQVLVIHDLAFENYPNDVPYSVRKYYQYFTPRYAKKASKILTVSEFSKNDIVRFYDVKPEKISVVYNGSREGFKPLELEERNKIKNKLTDGTDYFFYLGALHQRKNIKNLLLAFDLFKENDEKNIKLVIGGRKAWGNKEMELAFQNMKYKDEVIFTGWLSDDESAQYMASCLSFVYLSYFEGFGIPILEALNSGVPVLSSDKSSLTEVGGNAALYCNPFDTDDICRSMQKLAIDEKLRQELISNAQTQKEKFSWEKTADEIWNNIIED
jgi:glycosyltransferase involved in cell wall biosynthesis